MSVPKYLSAMRLESSHDSLAESRGKAALMDFLILKRTLVIHGANMSR